MNQLIKMIGEPNFNLITTLVSQRSGICLAHKFHIVKRQKTYEITESNYVYHLLSLK